MTDPGAVQGVEIGGREDPQRRSGHYQMVRMLGPRPGTTLTNNPKTPFRRASTRIAGKRGKVFVVRCIASIWVREVDLDFKAPIYVGGCDGGTEAHRSTPPRGRFAFHRRFVRLASPSLRPKPARYSLGSGHSMARGAIRKHFASRRSVIDGLHAQPYTALTVDLQDFDPDDITLG